MVAVNSAMRRNNPAPAAFVQRWSAAAGVKSISRIPRDINLLSPGESVDTHSAAHSRAAMSRMADNEARPQGGLNEAYETRFRGWVGGRYRRTPCDRQRTGTGCDHQDR